MTFWKKALYSKGLHRCTQISLQDWAFKTLLYLSMSRVAHSQEAGLPHPQPWNISLCTHKHSPGQWPSAAKHQASFYPGTSCSKHLQLSEMSMPAAESFSPASAQDYAGHMAARSDSKGQYSNCSLTDATRTSPFCYLRKMFLSKRKGWSLNLIKLGFFKTKSAEHDCISPSLALYKRVLHKKTLNFQGVEDTSQQFCAHCPYLREEWSKGLVHDPDRYEPRETTSYHHGPSVQLQQANINTILSKSCSHWRVIPSAACHELQQGDSQETWHHCGQFPVEKRDQKILEMLQFSLTWGLYSKTEHYLRRKLESTENNLAKSNQNNSAASEEGESWESLHVLLRSHSFSILFSSPGDSELWYREDTCLLAHIPWDRLWNDWLNLTDHHREEGVAVQRCYHNEQLCLHYQVTVLISCGSADTPVSAQAGKLPADPYSN